MSTVQVVSVTISVVCAAFAGLAWYASHRSAQLSAIATLADINQFVLENAKLLGPLTPYSALDYPDDEAVRIRAFLIARLNRFRHGTALFGRHAHKRFRQDVMGSSLTEFRDKIIQRGGSREFANRAAGILLDIKEKEPYFRTPESGLPGLWDTVFSGFDWSEPTP